jgi:murein DD-endopeptidase MepM/ murein hydrolase activator NlpD
LKTKFISIDGFNEIEDLHTTKKLPKRKGELNTAQKTVRFVKRAAKLYKQSAKSNSKKPVTKSRPVKRTAPKVMSTTALDKIYNENRQGKFSEFNGSAKESITSIVAKNNAKYAHSAPNDTYRTHTLLKRRAVLAGVACLTTVMISCVTVASALDNPNGSVQNAVQNQTTQSSQCQTEPEAMQAFSDNYAYMATDDEANNFNYQESVINPEIRLNSGFAGLYIDDKLIGATSHVDELKSALDKVLTDYRADYDEGTTTEFANKVEVKAGSFNDSELMSVDDIMAAADGKFSISLSTDMVYNTELAYDTETEYDDSENASYEKVKTEGENGEAQVTIRTTFVDGVQTDAVVSDTKVIKEAKDEVIVKGSKGGVTDTSASGSSSGQFIWPLPYTHTLTSNFEWRWGRMHWGIDISDGGVYGQPIIAADGGTVTFAGNTGGGYGNFVIIDHGNGYQTIYGHASELAVTTGQSVAQGDTIAYVGSTGNSTGPHLHFEIVENGEKVDPLNFVS